MLVFYRPSLRLAGSVFKLFLVAFYRVDRWVSTCYERKLSSDTNNGENDKRIFIPKFRPGAGHSRLTSFLSRNPAGSGRLAAPGLNNSIFSVF
jgi:hypothetical protein